ncbi:MAG: outer membrane beta-barrel protein [Saprospiraceae bacterium]|nr:outer membrane beta-barrel protein [Saprospiraceae bacterium]
MKTINFLFLLLTMTITLSSQSYVGSISGGASISTFDYGSQVNGVSDFDNSRKAGINAGLNIGVDTGSEAVTFMPGLFFQQNGSKEYYTDFNQVINDFSVNRNVNLDYVGMAFPIEFQMINEDYTGFMASVCGFVDYAVSGSIDDDFSSSSEIEFNSVGDRIDAGFQLNFSYVFSPGVALQFGYSKGIKNIEFAEAAGYSSADSEDEYLINNNGLTLKFLYLVAE